MTHLVRAASPADLDAIYRMAKRTGGGFTNLPPDRAALAAKLDRAARAFARDTDTPADDRFVFVLEDTARRAIVGTCQIFARVGSPLPFYSYRLGAMTQHSNELDRTFRAEMLTLCTDLDGTSEVGGLFLLPGERAGGIGKLLARSRYLFIAMHRARFADRTIAELRGAHDETGNSPFWDGVAGRFFGMSFREADEFNAVRGNQFIADLMPKHPIYTAMIPESASAVIGVPHTSGRAAMRMLENEGFAYDGYVDIFDGGPTMIAPTDRIVGVRDARVRTVSAIAAHPAATPSLVATGRLAAFRAACAQVYESEGNLTVDPEAATALGVSIGDTLTIVDR
jgi:arginine N-succinyltransferase